jgi:hypothetical protein
MPCCTFDRNPEAFHPVGIFLICGAMFTLGPPLLAALALLALVLPPLRRPARGLRRGLAASWEVAARDFLHPRYRCAVSARLMRRSPRLAGALYRNLNVAVLLTLWITLFGAAGTTAALWG